MTGWKVWATAGATAAYALVLIYQGQTDEGVRLLLAAGAMVGFGHKLDKAAPK